MNPAQVQWLAGEAGRAVVAALPPYDPATALATSDRLRADGLAPELVAAALTQARLRAQVGARWGPAWDGLATHLLLTADGAEQATRPVVAELRADRYESLGPGSAVADLGCGVGVDALALAGRGLSVTAFEQDPVTAAVATANASFLRPRGSLTVVAHDVRTVPLGEWAAYDAAFADPARRLAGRRLSDPEQWAPPLRWVLALPVDALGVKVAPGLAHGLVPPGTEFDVVSVGGEVVEAGLYRGGLRHPRVSRSATVVPPAASGSLAAVRLTDLDLPDDAVPVRPVGRFVHEPDGAVIRAGLVAALAARIGAWQLDPQIAYLSSDDAPSSSPLLSSFEVSAVLPFSLKSLRAHLRAEGVGGVVVKKRGSAVDVDDLRRSLRLDPAASGRPVVLLTRVGSAPIAIVATAVARRSADRLEGGDEVPVVDEG